MPFSPAQTAVSPADFSRLLREVADLRDAVDRLARAHQIEVTRVGQLQADIDRIRAAWSKQQAG